MERSFETQTRLKMSKPPRAIMLYRKILQQHRRLPSELRQLGDRYVREEFGRHKNAEPRFLGPFYEQWEAYLKEMEQRDMGAFGRDLARDQMNELSEEQRIQLERLRDETRKDS